MSALEAVYLSSLYIHQYERSTMRVPFVRFLETGELHSLEDLMKYPVHVEHGEVFLSVITRALSFE